MTTTIEEDDWLPFRKSTFSGGGGCVDVAFSRDGSRVRLRDTKAHGLGPELEFSAEDWAKFLLRAHAGDFGLPPVESVGDMLAREAGEAEAIAEAEEAGELTPAPRHRARV